MRRERSAGQVLFRADRRVEGAAAVRALGGVLGHIASHLLGTGTGGAVENLDVDLAAPASDSQGVGDSY